MKRHEMFVSQFRDILDYFSILNEVDTENVPPAYLSSANKSVTREDEIEESVPTTGISCQRSAIKR